MADLSEIEKEILNEVYSECEPPLDFDKVLENPDDYSDDWYKNHYIPKEREQEILDKHLEKHDLTEREETTITMTTILYFGPSNTKSE